MALGATWVGILWLTHRSVRETSFRTQFDSPETLTECGEILALIPDPVIVMDSSETIVYLNEAARTRLGVDKPGRVQLSFKSIQLDGKMLEELSNLSETEMLTTKLVCQDARTWPVDIHLRTLDENFTLRYVATLRTAQDARARKESSPELDFNFYQAQKMEAVGLLAGGVAHDFNNLLAVIGGSAEDLEDDGDRGEMVQRINQAVDRAKSTTRHLLTFSRRHLNAYESLDFNDVFEQTLKRVSGVLPEGLKLNWTCRPGDYGVYLNREQSGSLLHDLLLNARDAIAEEGTIDVGLVRCRLDHPRRWAGGTLAPGDYAQLHIADDGCGMSKEVQARVFEPFFTTKSDDLRNGFGLASVYGIVKAAGGGVFIQSEVGVGTRIEVLLPIQSDAVPPKLDFVQNAPSEGEARCDLRIALVEDESSLRTLLERTLSRAGYKVESATNGVDAVESFLPRAGDFDILVTDVVMPKLRGPALARRLREANPELKVVFMSGYTDGALEGVELGSDPFLQKPFSPTEFLETLVKLSKCKELSRNERG